MPLKLNPTTCSLDMVMGPGSGTAATEFAIDDNTSPGTNPVLPTVGGEVTIEGATVAAHSIPIETHSRALNSLNIEVQVGSAITGAPANTNNAGLVSFDDTEFSVDANGFVQLLGGGEAIDSNTGDDGVEVLSDLLGNFNWLGQTVANAAHAKPVYFKDSATANALDLDVQVATEITGAPGDKNDAGLSSYDDTMFSVDADGYVSLVASASFTTGSVIFWGASSFAEDNSNFFWDDTNNRLGIGTNTPLDTVHIVGNMDLVHVATESDDHALELYVDAAGFGDVKALDINYVTGAITAEQDEEAILLNIDESASLGGIINGYEVLTTSEGSAVVNGYTTGINVNPIVHESGTFGDADNILNIAVDVTAALASGGAGGISIFVADNDTFTVGDAATWEEFEIILDTGASGGGVAPTFEYSTGGAAYSAFSPSDGTNGFRNSGAILWNSSTLAGWATATSGRFEIRITRTRNSLSTTPIIDELQISSTTEFKWDKDGDVNINSLSLVVPLTVPNGGTGLATITDGGIMLGSGTGAVTPLGQATNGQLPIGSTSADPVLATLTAGTGVSITNGAGSITINATGGGFTWNDVTGTSDDFEASNGYIANNAGLVTITLPTTCAVGDSFRIAGLGAGGWLVAQNASQLIHLGNMVTTTGVGGSLASTNQFDTLEFLCVATNNEFLVLNSVGIITVT